MKRAEFVTLYADLVAERRQEIYPDTRRSEAAMNRLSDMENAARLWRKHRATMARLTVIEARAVIAPSGTGTAARPFLVPPSTSVQ